MMYIVMKLSYTVSCKRKKSHNFMQIIAEINYVIR